jgi:hypothetical protein
VYNTSGGMEAVIMRLRHRPRLAIHLTRAQHLQKQLAPPSGSLEIGCSQFSPSIAQRWYPMTPQRREWDTARK